MFVLSEFIDRIMKRTRIRSYYTLELRPFLQIDTEQGFSGWADRTPKVVSCYCSDGKCKEEFNKLSTCQCMMVCIRAKMVREMKRKDLNRSKKSENTEIHANMNRRFLDLRQTCMV